VRPLVKPGVPLPKMSPYPGHYAVVRSLVEGLRAIDADFNFNPRRTADLARVVYAPENASLRQAAALKRRGRIDYLVAGPVNALFPDEADSVLQLPEIDRLIVASEWVHGLYGETPKLLEKSVACPCGIDARYWHRSGQPRMKTALDSLPRESPAYRMLYGTFVALTTERATADRQRDSLQQALKRARAAFGEVM